MRAGCLPKLGPLLLANLQKSTEPILEAVENLELYFSHIGFGFPGFEPDFEIFNQPSASTHSHDSCQSLKTQLATCNFFAVIQCRKIAGKKV